jgi:hypothetical protein
LPNAEKLLKLANHTDLAKFVVVETEETLEDILDGQYDKDVAKERRDKRDRLHGRPFPFFTERTNDDDGGGEPSSGVRGGRRKPAKDVEEVEDTPPSSRARSAAAAEEQPEKPTSSRRRQPEPEIVSANTSPQVGARVRFTGDGTEMEGTITELHLDDAQPYVTVDTGDGDDPWDVNADEITLINPPVLESSPSRSRRRASSADVAQESEAEEETEREAKLRRRRERDAANREKKAAESDAPVRRASKDAEEPEEDEPVNKNSIVDRVSQLQRSARGER